MCDLHPLLFDLSLVLLYLSGREVDSLKIPGKKIFRSQSKFPNENLHALRVQKLIKNTRKNTVSLTGPGLKKARELFGIYKNFDNEHVKAIDIKQRLNDLFLLVIYLSSFQIEKDQKPGEFSHISFIGYRLEAIHYLQNRGHIYQRIYIEVSLTPAGLSKALQLSKYYGFENIKTGGEIFPGQPG